MLQWRPTFIAVLALLALVAIALIAGVSWSEMDSLNFNW